MLLKYPKHIVLNVLFPFLHRIPFSIQIPQPNEIHTNSTDKSKFIAKETTDKHRHKWRTSKNNLESNKN